MTGQTVEYSEPIDLLKLYFEKEFPITDKIIVYKPSVGDIVEYPDGESGFSFILHVFTGNTTYFKVFLWDNGIDWNKLTDFEMFCDFITGLDLTVEKTKILFGELDFSNFKKFVKQKEVTEIVDEEEVVKTVDEIVLYDPINDIVIDELTYFRIRFYLRHMFNFFPEIETGIKGKRMKKEIIEYDRKKATKNTKDSGGSFYLPLISFCLNHPGFKYKKDELKEIGIVEFLDSVSRLVLNEHCRATLNGIRSGFVDGSKIKPDEYDFTKDIYANRKSETVFEKVNQYNQSLGETGVTNK